MIPESAAALLAELISSPTRLAVVLALPVALCIVATSADRPPRHAGRDPQRAFSAAQRQRGIARAGGRCEAETLAFLRCRAPARVGDHWFPHARGGETSMRNFVAMCRAHNAVKSARLPSRAATARLQHRRRRYFPAGDDVDAGAWRAGRR